MPLAKANPLQKLLSESTNAEIWVSNSFLEPQLYCWCYVLSRILLPFRKPFRSGGFLKYGYPKPAVFPLIVTNFRWFWCIPIWETSISDNIITCYNCFLSDMTYIFSISILNYSDLLWFTRKNNDKQWYFKRCFHSKRPSGNNQKSQALLLKRAPKSSMPRWAKPRRRAESPAHKFGLTC